MKAMLKMMTQDDVHFFVLTFVVTFPSSTLRLLVRQYRAKTGTMMGPDLSFIMLLSTSAS